MTLTVPNLEFVRDHDVIEVINAGIAYGFSQADMEFALRIKEVQYLERIAVKR